MLRAIFVANMDTSPKSADPRLTAKNQSRENSQPTVNLLTNPPNHDQNQDADPNKSPRTKVTVNVNNVPIKFTVDTGATIDLIDSHTYQQLQHKITLRKSHTKVYSYGSDTPIKLKGQFQAQIESKKQYTVSQVHVANGS